MQCSVELLDIVATSPDLEEWEQIAMSGPVREEFTSKVVPALKAQLLGGTRLIDLGGERGSCAPLWTEATKTTLIEGNQDINFDLFGLGLEGPFSPVVYMEHVRWAILDGPIDALVDAVRQHLADNCNVDPFLEEVEWIQ